jgi:AhpD family alkylhydroperoxidase
MPRILVHTTADAPGQSQEALRGLERRMGRLMNIHAEIAHAPVVLAAYQGIQRAITRHGSFDAKTREAIALAVAAVDKCAYCQSAHTVGGQAAGWSLEETVSIRDGTAAATASSALKLRGRAICHPLTPRIDRFSIGNQF